ncbi:CBS domain-containing protein [Thermodesulfobacteriota bacterium]
MFIGKSMTKKVITVEKDADILEAREIMAKHRIRHLPVVAQDNLLLGIVSDRDVRSVLPFGVSQDSEEWKKSSQLKVEEIMTKDPVTVPMTYTLQDALLLIQKKHVGAFPVVDENNRLKGIISVRDLLRAFTNVLGIGEPGALLCILVEEKVGQLKKIVDAITEENISFGSVLVARYWDEKRRAVFPYLLTQNVAHVKQKLEGLGFTLLDPMEWYLGQIPRSE